MVKSKWLDKDIDDLSAVEHIYKTVFTQEQGVPEERYLNDLKTYAALLAVYIDGQTVGTGRIQIEDGKYVLKGVAILKEHRGAKLGDFIVRLLIRKAYEMGAQKQWLYAWPSVLGFYARFGFEAVGMQLQPCTGCIEMVREGDITGNC